MISVSNINYSLINAKDRTGELIINYSSNVKGPERLISRGKSVSQQEVNFTVNLPEKLQEV